jgi:GMP synthase (glutamine-hydrolysing)
MIFVLDYGSQYTQLIAKRLRRLGFATEVLPGNLKASQILARKPAGLILSGSPASVGETPLVQPDPKLLDSDLPVLGLCFGYQFMATQLGGKLSPQLHREYGAARVHKTPHGESDLLTRALSSGTQVWMSHGDSVVQLPHRAQLLLESQGRPAGFSIPERRLWALQFHPEVHHTPEGDVLLKAFAQDICGLKEDWNLRSALDRVLNDLGERLKGVPHVYCAVSGGVDSTVLAALLSKVTRVHALFVDHGFQRAYELDDLGQTFSHFPNIRLEVIDARENFWKELLNVSDPEQKRKIIGRLFIETFYGHLPRGAAKGPGAKIHLGQGTIYSDVIESAANDLAPAQKIKSHHNVGGLPETHNFELVEPLRKFFKDEVREIGTLLGIAPESLARHPFPGPGLSIRCVGALTPERIEVLRQADRILHDELKARGLYHETWQALCVLLPISSVGVMGDGRSYESVLALRAVSSIDAMTAEASELPWKDLKAIASKIVNEVRGVNRVVYDLTSKPPGTIEWE